MILLDSNVVSALMLSRPDFTVVRQLNRFPPDDIWISSAAVMEVRLGLLISPVGRKRAAREAAFELLMGEIIRNRVAPLDIEAAEAAAKLHAERHARGRVVGTADTQIAGIAIARGAAVCTRNVRRFEDAGAPVVNPWG